MRYITAIFGFYLLLYSVMATYSYYKLRYIMRKFSSQTITKQSIFFKFQLIGLIMNLTATGISGIFNQNLEHKSEEYYALEDPTYL